jgi:hypothetical protein
MRMQPCEAAVPIDPELYVPWIPTPPMFRPIQRVPSGLPGPGGMGCAPAAQGWFGGYHQGFRVFVRMEKLPSGVGHAGWPTATGKERTRFIFPADEPR